MSVTEKTYRDIHPVLADPHQISPTAADAVRLTFNPSGLYRVTKIKVLTAMLISELEAIRDGNSNAGREASVAITQVQTASMWAVLAATKGMP